MQAFEHLLERQLIEFADRGHNQSIEFRSVKLLIAPSELHQGLKSNRSCPVSYLGSVYASHIYDFILWAADV